jgi:hypothetical protein
MCKSKSARSRPRRTRKLNRNQAGLRLRLETWAVTVTFFGLMTVTISQAMSFGQ